MIDRLSPEMALQLVLHEPPGDQLEAVNDMATACGRLPLVLSALASVVKDGACTWTQLLKDFRAALSLGHFAPPPQPDQVERQQNTATNKADDRAPTEQNTSAPIDAETVTVPKSAEAVTAPNGADVPAAPNSAEAPPTAIGATNDATTDGFRAPTTVLTALHVCIDNLKKKTGAYDDRSWDDWYLKYLSFFPKDTVIPTEALAIMIWSKPHPGNYEVKRLKEFIHVLHRRRLATKVGVTADGSCAAVRLHSFQHEFAKTEWARRLSEKDDSVPQRKLEKVMATLQTAVYNLKRNSAARRQTLGNLLKLFSQEMTDLNPADVTSALKKQGLSVHSNGLRGETLLHAAGWSGCQKAAEHLCALGANMVRGCIGA